MWGFIRRNSGFHRAVFEEAADIVIFAADKSVYRSHGWPWHDLTVMALAGERAFLFPRGMAP